MFTAGPIEAERASIHVRTCDSSAVPPPPRAAISLSAAVL
jgi:hypothetical protein